MARILKKRAQLLQLRLSSIALFAKVLLTSEAMDAVLSDCAALRLGEVRLRIRDDVHKHSLQSFVFNAASDQRPYISLFRLTALPNAQILSGHLLFYDQSK